MDGNSSTRATGISLYRTQWTPAGYAQIELEVGLSTLGSQRRALLAALSRLMRLKYLLHVEGHDSISKQVHVNLTEVNMHGTRIARIVVRHVSEATHPMDHRAQE